jgi:hypothetical protein
MLQREPEEGEGETDIIILTHVCKESAADTAIAKIEAWQPRRVRSSAFAWKSCSRAKAEGLSDGGIGPVFIGLAEMYQGNA